MATQPRLTGLRRAYVRYYFAALSAMLVVLSLVAFGDNLFTNVGQPSNSDPKMIVHGLFTGGWIVILFVQTSLVSARKVALHRKLGWWGAAIAAGLVLSTLYLFVAVWKGWAHMDAEVKANRLLMAGFVPFAALGFLRRRRTDEHKRLIFGGTLLLLEPILARVYDPLVVPLLDAIFGPPPQAAAVPPFDPYLQILFAVWLGLFGSLMLYDKFVLHRVHPVTWAALGWFIAASVVAYAS